MEAGTKLWSTGRLRRIIAKKSTRSVSNYIPFRLGLNVGALAACNTASALLVAWYVITRVGINAETDAFFASGALPQLAFLVVSATLLPMLVPLLATRGPDSFRDDALVFFLLTIGLFSLIAIALSLSSAVWVPLLVPGFTAAGKSLTVTLTRIQLLSMVLNAGIVALWAAQQARRKFLWVEFSGTAANLAGFAFLVLTLPRYGIIAAAWNAVFYNSLKLIFLLPILGPWQRPRWRAATVSEGFRLFKPLLPGQIYLRADPVLDRYLTSMTGAGSLSLLYVAQQIYSNIILVLSKAVVAPMAPKLAVEASEGAWDRYRGTYRSTLSLILLLTALGVLLLLAGGFPALRLTVGRGGITGGNAYTLWLIMIALAGAFAGGLLGQVTASGFYSMGNTKTPTKVSVFIYSFYIPLKVAAFAKYGLAGIAVTMSTYFVANFLVQFIVLEKAVSLKAS